MAVLSTIIVPFRFFQYFHLPLRHFLGTRQQVCSNNNNNNNNDDDYDARSRGGLNRWESGDKVKTDQREQFTNKYYKSMGHTHCWCAVLGIPGGESRRNERNEKKKNDLREVKRNGEKNVYTHNRNIFNRKNSGERWPAVAIRTDVHSATFSVVRTLTRAARSCTSYYYYTDRLKNKINRSDCEYHVVEIFYVDIISVK